MLYERVFTLRDIGHGGNPVDFATVINDFAWGSNRFYKRNWIAKGEVKPDGCKVIAPVVSTGADGCNQIAGATVFKGFYTEAPIFDGRAVVYHCYSKPGGVWLALSGAVVGACKQERCHWLSF